MQVAAAEWAEKVEEKPKCLQREAMQLATQVMIKSLTQEVSSVVASCMLHQ